MTTPTGIFRAAAIALHGQQPVLPLADQFGVHERNVRRWMGDDEQVPDGVWVELADALRLHASRLGLLHATITAQKLKAERRHPGG